MEVVAWATVEQLGKLYDPTWWAEYESAVAVDADNTLEPDNPLQVKYDQYEVGLQEATWILRTLSGGAAHPAETWQDDYETHGVPQTILRHSPVSEVYGVESITENGTVTSVMEFYHDSQQTVRHGGGVINGDVFGFPGCGRTSSVVRVTYTTKDTLPPGTIAKIAWLGWQHQLAATGSKSCALPSGITSITRQQVSWTILDPMDFLEIRMTGMGRIDMWLTAVRAAKPPYRVIDPVRSHLLFSRRINTALEPVPEVSIAAPQLNLRMTEGDPLDFVMTVVDHSDWALSAYVAQIRALPGTDTAVILELDVDIVANGSDAVLTLSAADGSALTAAGSPYYWDLQEVSGPTKLRGQFIVDAQVTVPT